MAGSIASALLLLLNMSGALLAPRARQTQILPSSADDGDEVDFFFPFLVLYKSGRVQRFWHGRERPRGRSAGPPARAPPPARKLPPPLSRPACTRLPARRRRLAPSSRSH